MLYPNNKQKKIQLITLHYFTLHYNILQAKFNKRILQWKNGKKAEKNGGDYIYKQFC